MITPLLDFFSQTAARLAEEDRVARRRAWYRAKNRRFYLTHSKKRTFSVRELTRRNNRVRSWFERREPKPKRSRLPRTARVVSRTSLFLEIEREQAARFEEIKEWYARHPELGLVPNVDRLLWHAYSLNQLEGRLPLIYGDGFDAVDSWLWERTRSARFSASMSSLEDLVIEKVDLERSYAP